MQTARQLEPAPVEPSPRDDIVLLRDVSWVDYLNLLRMRGEKSNPRIAYLDGVVEIMSPSYHHEGRASTIGALVEAWCLERDVPFRTFGSWTLREEAKQAGVEPDDCWVFDESEDPPAWPALAIEVVWTSGGVRKLPIYRRLGVLEVWVWRKGVLTPHVLRDGDYVEAEASEALPGIDLALVCRLAELPTSRAIRELREALRQGSSGSGAR